MSDQFWSSAGLEPKRKFRWLLYFAGAPKFIIKSVTKPSFQIGSTSHQFLQHTFNFPGRVTWQDISLTLVDPVDPDAAQTLYNMLQAFGYELPTNILTSATGMKTISKNDMVTTLGEFKIQQISANSNTEILEEWILKNPQITSVSFDGLDYTSDEALNITVGIKYDWATLNELATEPKTSWNFNNRSDT